MTTDVSQARKFENQLGTNTPASSSFRSALNSVNMVLPPAGNSAVPLTAPISVTGAASLYPATAPGTAWVPVATAAFPVTDITRPVLAIGSIDPLVQGAAGAGSAGGGNVRLVVFPSGLTGAPVVLFQKGTGNTEEIPAGVFELSGSALYTPLAPGSLIFQLQASNASALGQMNFAAGVQNAPELTLVQP